MLNHLQVTDLLLLFFSLFFGLNSSYISRISKIHCKKESVVFKKIQKVSEDSDLC